MCSESFPYKSWSNLHIHVDHSEIKQKYIYVDHSDIKQKYIYVDHSDVKQKYIYVDHSDIYIYIYKAKVYLCRP